MLPWYSIALRHAQGGGLPPKRQRAREQVRMEAAKRFEASETPPGSPPTCGLGVRQVEKWCEAWRKGGADALRLCL